MLPLLFRRATRVGGSPLGRRCFAQETKQRFEPPPDAPSSNPKTALLIGVVGCVGLAFLFMTERNDYGISWYADEPLDDSKVPVRRPGPDADKK